MREFEESTPDTSVGDQVVRVTVWMRGHVQGVGFRWWTRSRALELGLVGHARNTDDGRVEVMAQGRRSAVAELVRLLGQNPSTMRRPGAVSSVSGALEGPLKEGLSTFVER